MCRTSRIALSRRHEARRETLKSFFVLLKGEPNVNKVDKSAERENFTRATDAGAGRFWATWLKISRPSLGPWLRSLASVSVSDQDHSLLLSVPLGDESTNTQIWASRCLHNYSKILFSKTNQTVTPLLINSIKFKAKKSVNYEKTTVSLCYPNRRKRYWTCSVCKQVGDVACWPLAAATSTNSRGPMKWHVVCGKLQVGWLSGGFTPCRHLRPSSGWEHTIVTYSVRWLLDEWN